MVNLTFPMASSSEAEEEEKEEREERESHQLQKDPVRNTRTRGAGQGQQPARRVDVRRAQQADARRQSRALTRVESRLEGGEPVVLEHVEKSLDEATWPGGGVRHDPREESEREREDGRGVGRTVFPALSRPRKRILAFLFISPGVSGSEGQRPMAWRGRRDERPEDEDEGEQGKLQTKLGENVVEPVLEEEEMRVSMEACLAKASVPDAR